MEEVTSVAAAALSTSLLTSAASEPVSASGVFLGDVSGCRRLQFVRTLLVAAEPTTLAEASCVLSFFLSNEVPKKGPK